MAADQGLGGDVHALGVEVDGDVPDAAALQGRGAAAGEDAVEVAAAGAGEAGVEVGGGLARLQDGDRGGAEVEVERTGEALGQPGAGEVEMGDLAQRVDAGVGAAGGEDGDGLAGAGQDGGSIGALDGGRVALALPALERAAVIFEQQAVAGHRLSRARVPTGSAKPRCSSSGGIGALAGALDLRDLNRIRAAGDGQRQGR